MDNDKRTPAATGALGTDKSMNYNSNNTLGAEPQGLFWVPNGDTVVAHAHHINLMSRAGWKPFVLLRDVGFPYGEPRYVPCGGLDDQTPLVYSSLDDFIINYRWLDFGTAWGKTHRTIHPAFSFAHAVFDGAFRLLRIENSRAQKVLLNWLTQGAG